MSVTSIMYPDGHSDNDYIRHAVKLQEKNRIVFLYPRTCGWAAAQNVRASLLRVLRKFAIFECTVEEKISNRLAS